MNLTSIFYKSFIIKMHTKEFTWGGVFSPICKISYDPTLP